METPFNIPCFAMTETRTLLRIRRIPLQPRVTLIFRCVGGYLDSFISGLDTIYLDNTTEALGVANTVWRENSFATNFMKVSGPLVQCIKLSLAETTKKRVQN